MDRLKRSKTKNDGEPIWVDHVYMVLFRPWIIILATLFVVTPNPWLLAAMTSGAAFLKIDTGARPAAMGGAYTALADDINAMSYNPGGLANLTRREIGFTHAQWLLDTRFDFLGYAQPTKWGTFGLGVTRLAAGLQGGRTADRKATSSFGASDTAYTLGFGRTAGASGRTRLGANLKFLQSRIGSYSAETVAADIGAQYSLRGSPLSFGVSALNIGKGMRFLHQTDPLPLTLSAGAAYRAGGVLNIGLDVRHEIYDKRTDVSVGTEYSLLRGLSLRAGYASQFAAVSRGGALSSLGGLGAGVGLKTKNYRADYTFTPFGELGNAQRISVGGRW